MNVEKLAGAETYRQPLRPQFHYTPIQGHIGDATGLIYYQGQYHLFNMFDEWSQNRMPYKQWGARGKLRLDPFEAIAGSAQQATVPSLNARAGNLSESNLPIYDPLSGTITGNRQTGLCRQHHPSFPFQSDFRQNPASLAGSESAGYKQQLLRGGQFAV